MTTDAALVARTRDGDDEAFRALYERHRPAVERVCRKWLRDPYLVEDAVQTTFLKAWAALPEFSGGAELEHWLRRIAKNHCHDVWRGVARAEALGRPEELPAEHPDPATAHAAGECIDRLAVETMLRNLGRRDASLLVQRHIGESSVGALAAQWGLTKGAMDVALHRARLRARRLAVSEGLRGILPLGLMRRISSAFQRVGGVGPDAGGVLAGVCQVAVAVSLAVPAIAPAFADERQDVAPRPASPLTATSVPAADRIVQGTRADFSFRRSRHATGTAAGATRGRTSAAISDPVVARGAPVTRTERPSATVEFDTIEVSRSGPTVSSTPNYRKPQRSIGARVSPEVQPEAEEDRNSLPEKVAGPAFDAVCDVAKAGDPVTYCEE